MAANDCQRAISVQRVRVWGSAPASPSVDVSQTSSPATRSDYDVPLFLEVFDWDRDGSSQTMGGFELSLRQLLSPGAVFNVIEVRLQGRLKAIAAFHSIMFKRAGEEEGHERLC
jgi:hypothetical protein